MRAKDIFLWATAVVLLLRLATLGAFPLLDTSEARYGEIARLMASSGDWITPWFEPGVPFWGKPPLAFWLSAASFRLFGVGEIAARLPHWLLAAGTAWLVAGVARADGAAQPWRPAFLLATTTLFFVTGSAILTDPALLFAVTLSLAAAYHVLVKGATRWGLLFFVGLALGLLAKGPLAGILILTPVLSLAVFGRRDYRLWRALPWLKGGLLCAALVLPWYWAAEAKTPGFLDYFILGEHFRRFIDAGWQGDLYGTAHRQPRGTIWLLAFAATLPWCLALPVMAVRWWRGAIAASSGAEDGRDPSRFFLIWMLTPLVLFTFAGNILWTYVLPGLPGFTLWLDRRWRNAGAPSPRLLLASGALPPLAFALVVVMLAITPDLAPSEESLVAAARRESANAVLYYLDRRPFSARYYSQGQAGLVRSSELRQRLAASREGSILLAVSRAQAPNLRQSVPNAVPIGENKRFILFRIARQSS